MEGVINKTREPFSIRKKDFWDVADAYKLLRPEFTVCNCFARFVLPHDLFPSPSLLTSQMV